MPKPGDPIIKKIDWNNVDEVRQIYAENRQKMEFAIAAIKTCFVINIVFIAPIAVWLFCDIFSTIVGTGFGALMVKAVDASSAERMNVAGVLNALPLDYLFFSWMILIPTIVARIINSAKILKYIRFILLFVAVYSLIALPLEMHPISVCVMGFVYGFLGFWVDDITVRQYAVIDSLKNEKGYPMFIDYFDETHGVKHTNVKYLEYKKRLEEKHNADRVIAEQVRKNLKAEPYNPDDEFVPGVIKEVVLPEIADGVQYDDITKIRSREGDYEDIVSDFVKHGGEI
ncbi:MAG: hypothetical protein LBL87_02490 [Ruminococcus sp.]|jgi:hypothetical protein|nr:hypothetical protein [Ruminococcus sp.]